MHRFKYSPVLSLCGLSWLLCIIGGFIFLFRYSNTPGAQAVAHQAWPSASSIVRSDKPTLLVFAHPHCPCSEASVGELERLIPHVSNKFKIVVVFYKPKNRSISWVKGSLWNQVARMPNVLGVIDEGGNESEHFGANTSGQVMLYSKNGRLIFEGGITPGRGHSGDNYGRSAILAYATTGKTTIARTAVFGCSLKNPERAVAGENP